MFFSINQTPQENFSHHWQLGNFAVSTDAGWNQTDIEDYSIVFKGYADKLDLSELLADVSLEQLPVTTGNFCAIVFNQSTQELKIKSDLYRSFPIYIGDKVVTNLIPQSKTVWADSLLTVDKDFITSEQKFDVIGELDETHVSSIEEIDSLISNKILKWSMHNRLPIRIFLSGGIDTLLVYSYLKKLGIDHTVEWNNHIDYDKFWLANHNDITKFWAYNQIHHWNEPCVLATGAPGDEFTLRGPTTCNLFLMHHGTSILQLLTKKESYYHRDYFSLDKHVMLLGKQMTSFVPYMSKQDMMWNLCNINVNDWQHWHLGNTLTFTPLRDLRLFKLFLQLPIELATGQIMDSAVSRWLIEKNVPGLTKVLSDQKNTDNYMKNLVSLLT